MKYTELKPEQMALVDSFCGLYRLTNHELSRAIAQVQKVVNMADAGLSDILAQIDDEIPNVQGIQGAQPITSVLITADIDAMRTILADYNTDDKRQDRIKAGGI